MLIDLGGTVRARSAAETLDRLRPLLPRFGITRVMAQEGLGDIKIPVSVSCRPNSRFVSTSQGKGITRELADISAIMESIEGFHAERVPPATITASMSELAERFIPPSALPCVPQIAPATDDDPIEWLACERLADGERVLVPRRFLSMDQTGTSAEIATWNLFVTSNGLASGNTRDEAIVHGLYELIERDAVVAHRYERDVAAQQARRVDLATIRGIPHVTELLALLDASDLVLAVSALHDRFAIPVFAAAVRPRGLVDRAISSGCGAHYVPEVALSRAITEAVQSRITYISGSRDDLFPFQYADIGAAPEPPAATTELAFSGVPRPPRFTTFAGVIRWTLDQLAAHGLTEACVFDHQRPEYGDIPVVSVICPGLRVDLQISHQAKKG